jgi:pimeloyl-ACP methyl ester carboxylesterase
LRAFLISNLVHEADKSWRWRLNLDALKRFIGPIRSWDIRTPTSAVHLSLASKPSQLVCVRATEPQEGLQYKKPTLFVGGGKSQFIKPEYHEKIHAFFPNAKIEMIPVPTAPTSFLLPRFSYCVTHDRTRHRTPITGCTSRSRMSFVTPWSRSCTARSSSPE